MSKLAEDATSMSSEIRGLEVQHSSGTEALRIGD